MMTNKVSRRTFTKTGIALGAMGLMAAPRVHAAENNIIRIGLVGCGGRGRGAAQNAMTADPNCVLVAVGDAFKDKAEGALEGLKAQFGDRVKVKPENIYDGLECYKGVLEQCDVILLCETPKFRPFSLAAAIKAGKHVFCEKPVASDAAGIRSVMESAKLAKAKGLNLVSGLCWRYDKNVNDIMSRIKDGLIGDIVSVQTNYLTGRLWTRPKLEGDTEMMAQVRNWYNFAWLSGDFNTEQHVHSLDKASWVMGDVPPIAAYGLGGRMARTDQPAYGDIYDEMAVVYEYANGKKVFSYCRQQNGCFNQTDDFFFGTKGTSNIIGGAPKMCDYSGKVLYEQKKVPSNMYVLEHEALFAAIRSGGQQYINNGHYMAISTMLAILGRQACYTGKRVTWEEVMALPELKPTGFTWKDNPPTLPDAKGRYKVAVPGMGDVYHEVVR